MFDKLQSILFVQMHDDFGVTVGAELMSGLEQFCTEFTIVVDFTVEDNLHAVVFVAQRLRAAGHVNDAQSPMPECYAGNVPDGAEFSAPAFRRQATYPSARNSVRPHPDRDGEYCPSFAAASVQRSRVKDSTKQHLQFRTRRLFPKKNGRNASRAGESAAVFTHRVLREPFLMWSKS